MYDERTMKYEYNICSYITTVSFLSGYPGQMKASVEDDMVVVVV